MARSAGSFAVHIEKLAANTPGNFLSRRIGGLNAQYDNLH
jgi:hypothetical protein